MRRVKVVYAIGVPSAEYKCEAAVYGADSRNLLLRKVYTQDLGSMRIIADARLIPLSNVLSVDESQW